MPKIFIQLKSPYSMGGDHDLELKMTVYAIKIFVFTCAVLDVSGGFNWARVVLEVHLLQLNIEY
jgi:hypothetical protein